MIDFYSWDTPNGQKIRIMLEECGLEYRVHPVDLTLGEQFSPEFLAINPLGQVPALQLDNGTCIAESLPICRSTESVKWSV